MKNYSKSLGLKVIIASVFISLSVYAVKPFSQVNKEIVTSGCDARSLFGGSCSVTCENDETPFCHGTIFKVNCTCLGENESFGNLFYSPADETNFNEAKSIADGFASSTGDNFSGGLDDLHDASDSGDLANYESAAVQLELLFQQLSQTEQGVFNTWIAAKGY